MKILLIDDSPAEHFLYKCCLEEYNRNIAILSAYDGHEAIELWEKNQDIDYIFLDINMPGMDGFEFLDEFAKRYNVKDEIVIMLTSSTRDEDRQKALEYNCVMDFVTKPLSQSALKKVLD